MLSSIYIPDIFFNTAVSSTSEYFDCHIERDAREYVIDYCTVRKYWEEVEALKEDEEQIELIIRNKLSPRTKGMSDGYFRLNPTKPSIVPRNYHYGQSTKREVAVSSSSSQASDTALGCLVFVVIAIIVIYLIHKFI
jgi:hypothetical protein